MPITDTALIFEGGGMRAAYSAGAVATLLENGIDFSWVAGISAGSSCTVNYVSRDAKRARDSFVDFMGDPRVGNWLTWFQGKGLFNAHFIYEETAGPGQVLPFDFASFQANPAEIDISAFDCASGEAVHWHKADVPRLEDLMVRVRASSTMPVLMPPTTIDGRVYVDGALGPSGGIALDAAKAAGFKRFFVVLTQPRAFVKHPIRGEKIYRWDFRKYPAVADALAERHRNYNATKAELLDLEASGDACLFFPETMPVSNSTTDVAELRAAYVLGLAQARSELGKWKEFLGV
ncbi:MAG: patatin family protein [Propionibacteriaceae bacterium]|jgi:predicted patatin/cPLA2 family phospholipase|nr:patatin family protein [Propionibacteriaceae bacterium]